MVISGKTMIAGVGVYLPEQRVSSTSLMEEINSETRFGLPCNWIDTRIGIEERRMAGPDEQPSSMAIQAGKNAIENAGIHPRDIDAVIYSGIETDFIEPSTAHVIQHALEASNAICFDISNACQGAINALAQVDAMIAAKHVETALICTSSLTSPVVKEFMRLINKNPDEYMKDRLGMLTAGDASAAFVVTREKDGSGLKNLSIISIGGWEKHCYYKYVDGQLEGQMLMKGMTDEIDKLHTSLISNTYHYLGWDADEIDYLFCHQVGKKTHRDLSGISGVPISRMPEIYRLHGNITTCSIPLAMHNTELLRGDKVLMMGGGSGFSSFQGGMVW